jgi:uncharacterized protein (DUF488 family)
MISPREQPSFYLIGHSTRTIDSFIEILTAYDVKALVDVRTIPKSRHNPQYNKEVLAKSLRTAKIRYKHMKELGGLRRPRPDSQNKAWRNSSFRGYADYMQTKDFEISLKKLIEFGSKYGSIAIMCAESVPWRCHRSLIADALLVRKIATVDIFSEKISRAHRLTPWAKVRGKRVTYP